MKLKLAIFSLAALFAFPAFAQVNLSVESLVSTVVYLVVIGLIFWLLWWFIGYCAIPEPFNKVARVLVALVAVIIVISLLLGMAGHPLVNWR